MSYLSFAQSKIDGHYVSNFAIGGRFLTQIQLNADSTFKYQKQGELTNDIDSGRYSLINDTIVLNYTKIDYPAYVYYIKDSTNLIWDSIPNIIKRLDRPEYFLLKNKKLWVINIKGEIVDKAPYYNRKKSRIGNNMKKRKYYLEKVEYEWEIW